MEAESIVWKGSSRSPSPGAGALPLCATTCCSAWVVPGSGSARPLAFFALRGPLAYGKARPCTVVGASGSFWLRKSAQTRLPFLRPNFCLASSSTSAEPTSPPPPLPKIPATSDAVAITSVTFHGSGPCGWPSAGYSTGISEAETDLISAMYWLIPST